MTSYPALGSKAIALIIPDLDQGGEETRVVLFANSYVPIFKHVYLFAPEGVNSALLHPEVQHIITNVRNYTTIFKVLSFIKRHKIDFLQGHKRATMPYLLAAEKLIGCTSIFNFDNIYPSYNGLSKLVTPHRIIYLSNELAEFYASYYPASNNQVINMGGEFYNPPTPSERASARQVLGLQDGQVALLSLGRLSPQKNQQLLLQALHELQDPTLICLLAGNGPDEDALRQLTNEYGLEHQVRFLGHVSAPCTLLTAADVLVQSSRFEGFPNVFIEAASVGLPIIATNVGSAKTLVSHQGILVTPGAVTELANAIGMMQQQLAAYQQQALALRESPFFRQFHKSEMVAGYLRYYEALAST
jgi:glycosyltransferase involved in cell wall biosynthesis